MSQALARKTVSVLAVVATIGLLAAVVAPTPAQANSYSCKQGVCIYEASCDGTYFVQNGCTVQCYVPKEGSTTGELTSVGSATCGGGGGGGDDGGGDWWCGTYCW